MITHEDIKNLVTEWSLREDIIEKDYVLGWILWGIGSDPDIGNNWIFKGGTCIKKCYIETYRFSEDLDFTVLPGGLIKPDDIRPIINRILEKVEEESGINLSIAEPKFKERSSPLSIEGRIYYKGPRNTPSPASIKLDLNGSENIICPSVLRKISHPYDDKLLNPAHVRCYSFEEVFAEKIRAMGERSRPRDLYDIINLFRRKDLQAQPKLIKDVLIKKCETKEVPIPSFISIKNSPYLDELKSEWKNMLSHQLQVLPPFEQFWEELLLLFNWLEGIFSPESLESIPIDQNEDTMWYPPPIIWNWGMQVPLESIRFAAINHLCIELGYNNSKRIVEPYSLRRTKAGNYILHTIRISNQEHRAYRIERIQSIKVINKPFKPKYQIEFASTGIITASQTTNKPKSIRRPNRGSPVRLKYSSSYKPKYIYECPYCNKKFTKTKHNPKLNNHKDKNGYNCPGRIGYFIETRID